MRQNRATLMYYHSNSNHHHSPLVVLMQPLSSSSPSDSSYFFKGKEYWRVVGSDMEVEAGYPRSIGKDWLVCTEMQSDSPATEANNTANTRLHGQHHADHAENGYEVCSCTSNSASPLGAQPSPSPFWLLALLTISGVLSYVPL